MHHRNSHFFNAYICRCCCCYYYYVTRSNEHEISIFYRSSSYMLASASASSSCSMLVLRYIIHLVRSVFLSPSLCVCACVFMQNVAENRCCCFDVVLFLFLLFCFFGKPNLNAWRAKLAIIFSSLSVSGERVRGARVVAIRTHTVCQSVALGHICYYITAFYSRFVLSLNGISICKYTHTQHHHRQNRHHNQPHRALGDIHSHLHIIFGIWIRLLCPKHISTIWCTNHQRF